MVEVVRHDIESREDILQLMRSFYEKLLADDLMRPVFIDVAKIDLEHHLPILTDFWQQILFQEGDYRGNPLQIHLSLHEKTPLTKHHFDTWLTYFKATVRERFEGPKAFMAISRADSIAVVMQQKIYLYEQEKMKKE